MTTNEDKEWTLLMSFGAVACASSTSLSHKPCTWLGLCPFEETQNPNPWIWLGVGQWAKRLKEKQNERKGLDRGPRRIKKKAGKSATLVPYAA